jgi:hypothetical protein
MSALDLSVNNAYRLKFTKQDVAPLVSVKTFIRWNENYFLKHHITLVNMRKKSKPVKRTFYSRSVQENE